MWLENGQTMAFFQCPSGRHFISIHFILALRAPDGTISFTPLTEEQVIRKVTA